MTQFHLRESLLFLDLCNPFCSSLSSVPSEDDWNYISQLGRLHGVTPFLYYRTRSLGIKLPEQIEREWLGIYLYQIAQEKKARRQIKELKEILDPERIPFILLKGASAMLRLYPQPGLRTFCDLDILIPVDKVDQLKPAMTMAGYKPLSARNSPEDEELQKFDVHLDPLRKEEGLMIEPHLSIFGVGGDHFTALQEIWQEKEEANTDDITVGHLGKEQFVVHTLLHTSRHLTDEGFAEIKWIIDLLYAIKAWKIEWSKAMDISRKWDVERDVLPVMATLNHYWQAEIPFIDEAKAIDPQTLVLGKQDREKEYYTRLPASYLERLLKLRKLPNKTSQVRYLLHLFFPTQENLRWRYGLRSEKSLAIYYFLHTILTAKKYLIGLWYDKSKILW